FLQWLLCRIGGNSQKFRNIRVGQKIIQIFSQYEVLASAWFHKILDAGSEIQLCHRSPSHSEMSPLMREDSPYIRFLPCRDRRHFHKKVRNKSGSWKDSTARCAR